MPCNAMDRFAFPNTLEPETLISQSSLKNRRNISYHPIYSILVLFLLDVVTIERKSKSSQWLTFNALQYLSKVQPLVYIECQPSPNTGDASFKIRCTKSADNWKIGVDMLISIHKTDFHFGPSSVGLWLIRWRWGIEPLTHPNEVYVLHNVLIL